MSDEYGIANLYSPEPGIIVADVVRLTVETGEESITRDLLHSDGTVYTFPVSLADPA